MAVMLAKAKKASNVHTEILYINNTHVYNTQTHL